MTMKKRIAAIAAAMIMSVSTMAVSASAATSTKQGTGMSDTGTIRKSLGFGYAESVAVNLSGATRYMRSEAQIFKSGASSTDYLDNSVKKGDVANTGALTSGEAHASSSICYRARIIGILYNSTGTIQGGEYGSVSFYLYY